VCNAELDGMVLGRRNGFLVGLRVLARLLDGPKGNG
jgi:hypothetical protein